MVVGFVVAGVYAVGMLRGRSDRYHQLGFRIPFTIAAVITRVQIVFGDTVARAVAKQQPQKFAAMELVQHTRRGATEWLGGIGIGMALLLLAAWQGWRWRFQHRTLRSRWFLVPAALAGAAAARHGQPSPAAHSHDRATERGARHD